MRDAPFFCGEFTSPGRPDVPEWHDWSRRETTFDQLRIEEVLETLPIAGAALLHVGCGNSSLARRFAARLGRIDGITVSPEEKALAESLRLPNYRALLLNKYSPALAALPGGYQYVVDNNPAGFACCRFHLATLFHNSFALLAEGGLYLTDALGLGWVADGGEPAMAMNFEDLVEAGAQFGFVARRETDLVCSLRRGPR